MKLEKDASVAKQHGIMHLDDPRFQASSEKYIFVVIQTADAFVNNYQKLVPVHSNFFDRHVAVLHNYFDVHHLEHKKAEFPTFAPLLNTKIQQTKIVSHQNIALSIRTMRPSGYDAEQKSKMWEAKAEMREWRFLLKSGRHISQEKNSFSNQSVLGENSVQNTAQKGACGTKETKALRKRSKLKIMTWKQLFRRGKRSG